jgi:hypothetical protein
MILAGQYKQAKLQILLGTIVTENGVSIGI